SRAPTCPAPDLVSPFPVSPRRRLPARIATDKLLRLSEGASRPAHLFLRRDREPCPRRQEASIVQLLAAQNLCNADQPVDSNRAANLGGVASAGLRHHPRRFADSQNQVPENPFSAVARHSSDRARSLLDAPPSNEEWGRPCFCFRRRATARLLESSQRVPDSVEIRRDQALPRSMAAYS